MTSEVDVLGIGNAIVDLLCSVKEDELKRLSLVKGSMTLVEDQVATDLGATFTPVSMQSGGSIANSLAHVAGLGGHSQLIGKVADDATGLRFREDAAQIGMQFDTPALVSGVASGRCFVFVTPDGERTMCTNLGASSQLSQDDIDATAISSAKVLLVEGYLWSSPSARQMILSSVSIARESGTVVAFSLSDSFLVDAFRSDFQTFVEQSVDLLIANEHEAEQLYATGDIHDTLDRLQQSVAHLVITRGAKGSVVVLEDQTYEREATSVVEVVDTTGAGDAYAGGYLYGLTQDFPVAKCMDIASDQAAVVIGQYGGRVPAA